MESVGGVQKVELIYLFVSPLNARKHFDEAKMKELAASIKEKGVIEPIIVRPKSGKIQKYEIVCGERRYKASLSAGLKDIPVIVRDLSDEQTLEFQIIENLQREDLDPLDEAAGFKTMLDKCKYTQADLATKVGKSQAYIANRMRLLDLSKDIQEAISSGDVTPGHGMVLLRLNDQKDQAAFFKAIVREKLSIRSAENHLKDFGRSLASAPFDKKNCEACNFNGNKQQDFFDKETNLRGRCMDPACFAKKMDSFINSQITELKKSGVRVIAEKSYRDINSKSGISTALLDSEYSWRKKELGQNYKEKCLKCEKRCFVIMEPEDYGQTKGISQLKEYCLNAKCLSALTRPNTSGSKENENWKKEQNKRHSDQLVTEAQERFWKEKLVANRTTEINNAITAYFLLNKLEPYGEIEDILPKGFKKNDGYISYSVMALYNLGNKAILDLINKAIGKLIESAIDDDDLEPLTKEVKFDAAKDFMINEAYLQPKTKDELVSLAKEVGLDKHLKAGKYSQYLKFDILKKLEMIDCFLKKGFDLKGKVPKEMAK